MSVSQLPRDWNRSLLASVLRVYHKLIDLGLDIIMEMDNRRVSIDEIIKYLEEIDAVGKKDGFPRNPYLPDVLRAYSNWELRDLTEDEFTRLILPDGSGLLIRDKDLASVLGDDSILVTQKYLLKLNRGEDLTPLIIRIPLENNPQNASFYIEDGAHRAIAAKVYFEKKPYKPIKAYIGNK